MKQRVLIHFGFPGNRDYSTSEAEVHGRRRVHSVYVANDHAGYWLHDDQLIGHPSFDPGMPVRYEVLV